MGILTEYPFVYWQVSRIKERVEEKEGIPPVQQRLIYGGKQMYVTSQKSYGAIISDGLLSQFLSRAGMNLGLTGTLL